MPCFQEDCKVPFSVRGFCGSTGSPEKRAKLFGEITKAKHDVPLRFFLQTPSMFGIKVDCWCPWLASLLLYLLRCNWLVVETSSCNPEKPSSFSQRKMECIPRWRQSGPHHTILCSRSQRRQWNEAPIRSSQGGRLLFFITKNKISFRTCEYCTLSRSPRYGYRDAQDFQWLKYAR